ncbi:hypothetical protein EJ04DRAFT_523742 [Polyplosphaeria fusca]|uniref:Secreted protein n=1 Tax=Polyplosphaeria fusca TaxID=682080 RepID=A0A9P4QUV6_9PLEO|nr:hypothetical protein EJ04DRAFT_523742 [Polyplosphaeria fusca]
MRRLGLLTILDDFALLVVIGSLLFDASVSDGALVVDQVHAQFMHHAPLEMALLEARSSGIGAFDSALEALLGPRVLANLVDGAARDGHCTTSMVGNKRLGLINVFSPLDWWSGSCSCRRHRSDGAFGRAKGENGGMRGQREKVNKQHKSLQLSAPSSLRAHLRFVPTLLTRIRRFEKLIGATLDEIRSSSIGQKVSAAAPMYKPLWAAQSYSCCLAVGDLEFLLAPNSWCLFERRYRQHFDECDRACSVLTNFSPWLKVQLNIIRGVRDSELACLILVRWDWS